MAELLLGCLQPAEGGHVVDGGIVELLQRGFGPADGLVRYLDQILVPVDARALALGVLDVEHATLRPPAMVSEFDGGPQLARLGHQPHQDLDAIVQQR